MMSGKMKRKPTLSQIKAERRFLNKLIDRKKSDRFKIYSKRHKNLINSEIKFTKKLIEQMKNERKK
jgi:hypothetical protein